jgi:hypothetical protein
MAGSDKKERKLASGEPTFGGTQPLVVQDPDVSHFVMTGNPTGLIPRAALNADQKTTITAWNGALPPNGRTDTVRLQITRWGSNEWTTLPPEQSFTGGDTWVPLVFTILSTFFLKTENEGAFDLRYEHENYLGVTDYSGRVPIHIDKVPPNGATPPAKMVFAVTAPITDATFGTNDFLEATIPMWTGDLLDAQVAFGWLKGELPEDPGDIDLIGPESIAPGEKVRIPKDKFIAAGDGLCCGGYVLIDKAGNISALSLYELMSVALGPLPPKPLPKPTAADPTGGELLREDIVNGGVLVNVPHVTNGKSTDTLVIKWKDQELKPGTPVGANPANGIDIFVPWDMILSAYGSATGVVDIPLSYTVLRGVEPFASDIETVKCNLSVAGPDNPTPLPGNSKLEKVTIVGKSGVDDVLIDTDEDEDINAKIELIAPLKNGDSYQVMWNGTPIGDPYVIDVADDTVGDTIEIPLDWDVIRDDPQQFKRNLKRKTVTPAASDYGQAPVLQTRYRYTEQRGLTGVSNSRWLALSEELLLQDGNAAAPLQHSAFSYIDEPDTPFKHGRKLQDAVTLQGKTTTTDYVYNLASHARTGESVLNTVSTLRGFNRETKLVTQQNSLFHAAPLTHSLAQTPPTHRHGQAPTCPWRCVFAC